VYDRLTGRLIAHGLTEIVLDVNGVGYCLTVPLSTSNVLSESQETTLLTHVYVREDQLRLFGFASPGERQLFRMLIGVSGIGPAIALAVLSGSSVQQFRRAVEAADSGFLSRIKGIGRKTAERIIVDLREPIKAIATSDAPERDEREQMCIDAVLALQSLGYSRGAAEKAVEKALSALGGGQATTQTLVRAALKFA
jgi:Holliday junction DNA helicase RuvA